jgi:Holliday junction resolvase
MAGARHRQKGDRTERELVDRHKEIGLHAERYPLSGASRFRDSGHDVDLYPFGRDECPLVCEVKARKHGQGFAQLEKWLGDYDALFLRRNHADPLVLLPWRVWTALLEKIPRSASTPIPRKAEPLPGAPGEQKCSNRSQTDDKCADETKA